MKVEKIPYAPNYKPLITAGVAITLLAVGILSLAGHYGQYSAYLSVIPKKVTWTLVGGSVVLLGSVFLGQMDKRWLQLALLATALCFIAIAFSGSVTTSFSESLLGAAGGLCVAALATGRENKWIAIATILAGIAALSFSQMGGLPSRLTWIMAGAGTAFVLGGITDISARKERLRIDTQATWLAELDEKQKAILVEEMGRLRSLCKDELAKLDSPLAKFEFQQRGQEEREKATQELEAEFLYFLAQRAIEFENNPLPPLSVQVEEQPIRAAIAALNVQINKKPFPHHNQKCIKFITQLEEEWVVATGNTVSTTTARYYTPQVLLSPDGHVYWDLGDPYRGINKFTGDFVWTGRCRDHSRIAEFLPSDHARPCNVRWPLGARAQFAKYDEVSCVRIEGEENSMITSTKIPTTPIKDCKGLAFLLLHKTTLFRVQESRVASFDLEEGKQNTSLELPFLIKSSCSSSFGTFFGGENGEVARFPEHELFFEPTDDSPVVALRTDQDGRLFVGQKNGRVSIYSSKGKRVSETLCLDEARELSALFPVDGLGMIVGSHNKQQAKDISLQKIIQLREKIKREKTKDAKAAIELHAALEKVNQQLEPHKYQLDPKVTFHSLEF